MATGEIAVQAGLGGGMAFIAVVSLILNVLAVVVYHKKKRLHGVPSKYFLLNLAIVDIMAVCFWSIITALSVISLGWILPFELCKIQTVVMQFCILLNMHTLAVMAFERFLLFHKPSRHEEIFIRTVVTILLFGLWFFDAIIAVFPVMLNWGEIAYFSNQYQCAMDYEKNIRHMNFMLVVAFAIPFLTVIVLNVFILIRLKILRGQTTPGNAIVTEKRHGPNGDSYAARLKRQNQRFQNAGTKNKKPKMEKKTEYTDTGYISNSDTNSESEGGKQADAVKTKKEEPVKKPFHLNKNDVTLSRTYLIITIVYTLLWLPYIVISYLTLQNPNAVSTEFIIAAVWISHCVSFIKPVIYVLHNASLRKCMTGTFCKTKNRYKNFGSKPPIDEADIPKDDFQEQGIY